MVVGVAVFVADVVVERGRRTFRCISPEAISRAKTQKERC